MRIGNAVGFVEAELSGWLDKSVFLCRVAGQSDCPAVTGIAYSLSISMYSSSASVLCLA